MGRKTCKRLSKIYRLRRIEQMKTEDIEEHKKNCSKNKTEKNNEAI